MKVKGSHTAYIEAGQVFACAVRESLRKWHEFPDDAIVFAYDTGALEIFEWCRERGMRCVLGQIDPGRVEADLVREEEKRWPGWAIQRSEVRGQKSESRGHPPSQDSGVTRKSEVRGRGMEAVEEYFQRREREWALADRIIVNSEWSRKALMQQGVSAEKLVVVPLAFETNAETLTAENKNREQKSEVRPPISDLRPLKVLFLGQVILRKGIQYLMEAARTLEKENIHFNVVGPIGISREAVASAPRNMTFHGPAFRDQTEAWYRDADLFVLPTLSDGFALTQLEAMARGLPVIATPNCARVVEEGKTGFIIPPRDPQALADAILRFLRRPRLCWEMAPACREAVKAYSIDALGQRLKRLSEKLLLNDSAETSKPLKVPET